MELKEYLFELQILDKSNSRLEFYLPYSKEKLFHKNDVNCNFYIFGESDLQKFADEICEKQRINAVKAFFELDKTQLMEVPFIEQPKIESL